jgi:hypothetical protein
MSVRLNQEQLLLGVGQVTTGHVRVNQLVTLFLVPTQLSNGFVRVNQLTTLMLVPTKSNAPAPVDNFGCNMAYQQFTLAQLLALFYDQVDQNTAFFTTDEATRILQEAFRVFNVMTGFWRCRVSAGLTIAGVHWYTVPAGISYIYRVELNETGLQSSSLYDLDYGRAGWENETCTSGTLPTVFAPAGVNMFAIWPASFAGGESLIIDGVIPAPVLTNTGFVNLGQDELKMILDEALHLAQFKEGGQEFEASEEAHKEFLKMAAERNGVLKQSAKFRNWMGLTSQKKRPMRQPDAQLGAR